MDISAVPSVVQMFLTVVGIIALLWAGIRLAIRVRQNNTNPAVAVILKFLDVIIDAGYYGLEERIKALAPEKQEQEIRRIAADLYGKLPNTIPVPLGKIIVNVPIKMIVSLDRFQDFAFFAYTEATAALDQIKYYIDETYKDWEGQS